MKTQCVFKNGNTQTTGWIDSKYAKKGLFVQLLTFGKMFWEIIFVGGSTTEDVANKYRTWNNNI